METVQDLPTTFRETASYLREHAASEQAARAWEKAAELLEDALVREGREVLTLEEAEVASGYTRSHLRRLVREGVIPNSGNDREVRIERSNLPRKPGYGPRRRRLETVLSRVQAARAICYGE